MTRILVVEDDEVIGSLVQAGLQAQGYQVVWVRTGQQARRRFLGQQAEIVLLDLGLPDADGVELCRELRRHSSYSTVIAVTARREPIDVVVGLDSGADDYVVKPFTVAELLARVRAHLRRREGESSLREVPTISCGALEIDIGARRCRVAGRDIALREKEFELLLALARAPGVAVSRAELLLEVWKDSRGVSSKSLDVTMAALRLKLGAGGTTTQSQRPPVITTLRGHGYRLDIAEAG